MLNVDTVVFPDYGGSDRGRQVLEAGDRKAFPESWKETQQQESEDRLEIPRAFHPGEICQQVHGG